MKKYILIFILFIIAVPSNAFNKDSLINVFNNSKNHDTTRLLAIDQVVKSFIFTNPDSALKYVEMELRLSKNYGDPKYIGEAYQNKGTSYYSRQQIDTCISFYLKSLNLFKEAKSEAGMASICNNIGIMYEIKADYLTAIEYYLKGISLREKNATKNAKSIARLNLNIGNVYSLLKEFEKARLHYNKSLNIFRTQKDSSGEAKAYMAIGLTFDDSEHLDSSIFYFKKSLILHESINDLKGVNQCKSNLGSVYTSLEKFDEALKYFSESKAYFDNTDDAMNQAAIYENLGSLYIKTKKYAQSAKLCEDALKISETHLLSEMVKSSCLCLYKSYKGMNQNEKALKFHEKYVEIKDSLSNEDLTKKIAQTEMQFEFDKKQLTDSLARAEQERIKEINHHREVEKQKTYTYVGAIGAILLLIILLVLFRGYTQKKRSNALLAQKNTLITQQKQEVEMQKHIVEEKNNEITDSINYAKRIQSAILPNINLINENFSDAFVLFKPKDVVSGDFYWFEKLNNQIIFAAADCTGHGVPGAMVSVVCSNALHKTVVEFNITQPSLILDKVREIVIDTFKKNNDEVKDGMDISICSIEKDKDFFKLQFAGANNPLWILRNGLSEIEEIKGDKQPVGAHFDAKPFTNHEIKLIKGDSIYLFSDGYPDQFGGDKGKKFKYRPFKELLIENSKLAMNKQHDILLKKFEEWKGQLDQVDDICIIGIKV